MNPKKEEIDPNLEILCNKRIRTRQAFEAQNMKKSIKFFYVIVCSHSFFKRRIIQQFYGDLIIDEQGSIGLLIIAFQ